MLRSEHSFTWLLAAAVSDITLLMEDGIYDPDSILTFLDNATAHWLASKCYLEQPITIKIDGFITSEFCIKFWLICIFWVLFVADPRFHNFYVCSPCETCGHFNPQKTFRGRLRGHLTLCSCGIRNLAGIFRAKVTFGVLRSIREHCVICVTSAENRSQCEGNHAILIQTGTEIYKVSFHGVFLVFWTGWVSLNCWITAVAAGNDRNTSWFAWTEYQKISSACSCG